MLPLLVSLSPMRRTHLHARLRGLQNGLTRYSGSGGVDSFYPSTYDGFNVPIRIIPGPGCENYFRALIVIT